MAHPHRAGVPAGVVDDAGGGDMSAPEAPGLYRFTGRRRYSRRNDYLAVNTIVEVRWYHWLHEPELAVFMFGSARPYRADAFEGEWTHVK